MQWGDSSVRQRLHIRYQQEGSTVVFVGLSFFGVTLHLWTAGKTSGSMAGCRPAAGTGSVTLAMVILARRAARLGRMGLRKGPCRTRWKRKNLRLGWTKAEWKTGPGRSKPTERPFGPKYVLFQHAVQQGMWPWRTALRRFFCLKW